MPDPQPPPPDAAAPRDDPREEAEIEEALARIHLLQVQISGLRRAIPKMLAPLYNMRNLPNAGPLIPPRQAEIICAAFQATVGQTMAELNTFSAAWADEATARLLARARDSQQADSSGLVYSFVSGVDPWPLDDGDEERP